MAERVLWSAEDLVLSIGRQTIFDHASMSINEGERLALVGRNGTGKSTLLRIIAGLEQPSSGDIMSARGLRIGFMPQEVDAKLTDSIPDIVRAGLKYFEELHRQYETVSQNSPDHARIERTLTIHDAWNLENLLEKTIQGLALPDTSRKFSELSGGERRRVILARTIISGPDLLLLDEPTNHLDIETVEWMEKFLIDYPGSILFVTHDRCFLDRIATRILELDFGKFYSCQGSYADFLEAKANREYIEDVAASKRNHFLRMEVEWVRRSPKARLSRNEGRLKRYFELAAIEAPKRTGDIELVIPQPPRLGNKVVTLKNISKTLNGKELIKDFSFEFTAGHKIGVVGGNGIGKTTLLKLITGELQPDSGNVERADTVIFNYVDQGRLTLDPGKTVCEEIGGDSDYVNLGNGRITVRSYLKRFLFEDERINTKIEYLSGGERARILLAKILRTGGNFMILDEPTNDLDLNTLRILEEALIDFPSTLLVVSHDRYFLNRVCNTVFAFEGDGIIRATPGDYDYYAENKKERIAASVPKTVKPAAEKVQQPKQPKKKLSYLEERELSGMEDAVAAVEEKIAALEMEFADPEFFIKRPKDAPEMEQKIAAAKAECDKLYARWEELETKKEALMKG